MDENDILDYIHPHGSVEEFNTARQRHLAQYPHEMQERIQTWLRIGEENPWIVNAYDPPFTELSFYICADIRELTEKLLSGNWCLGQAFALGNICFINQVDGGDEWLAIKGGTSFESITMQTYNERREEAETRLRKNIEDIQQAIEIQCKRLEYGRDDRISAETAREQEPVLDFESYEHLRTWDYAGFRIELYDTASSDRLGKSILAYEFYDEGFGDAPVFSSADFHCSPLHAIDSDATVVSLLSFLSMRPGETDAEHFECYTLLQLAWCEMRGEELASIADLFQQRQESEDLNFADI